MHAQATYLLAMHIHTIQPTLCMATYAAQVVYAHAMHDRALH
jgi:hypothetical protein